MSTKDAQKFLEKIDQDPSFKTKLQSVSREEVKNILQDEDLQFTQKELIEAYSQVKGRELQNEELAQIAAGVVPGTSGSIVVVDL